MANCYIRDQELLQHFVDDFSLSEEESSGKEVKGTHGHLGSEVVVQDAIAALRSAVATESLARSQQFS